jgi:hypothetical protein
MSDSLRCHGRRDELVRLPPCIGVSIADEQCSVVLDTGQGMLRSDKLAKERRFLESHGRDSWVVCQVILLAHRFVLD